LLQVVPEKKKLFHFDGRASVRELLLDGLGLFLGHALFDVLGGAVNQVLGFFQAQAGDFADGLDDFDLLRADILEDDGELGLGFSRGCARCRASVLPVTSSQVSSAGSSPDL
jgi:hypothetical protein